MNLAGGLHSQLFLQAPVLGACRFNVLIFFSLPDRRVFQVESFDFEVLVAAPSDEGGKLQVGRLCLCCRYWRCGCCSTEGYCCCLLFALIQMSHPKCFLAALDLSVYYNPTTRTLYPKVEAIRKHVVHSPYFAIHVATVSPKSFQE